MGAALRVHSARSSSPARPPAPGQEASSNPIFTLNDRWQREMNNVGTKHFLVKVIILLSRYVVSCCLVVLLSRYVVNVLSCFLVY